MEQSENTHTQKKEDYYRIEETHSQMKFLYNQSIYQIQYKVQKDLRWLNSTIGDPPNKQENKNNTINLHLSITIPKQPTTLAAKDRSKNGSIRQQGTQTAQNIQSLQETPNHIYFDQSMNQSEFES